MDSIMQMFIDKIIKETKDETIARLTLRNRELWTEIEITKRENQNLAKRVENQRKELQLCKDKIKFYLDMYANKTTSKRRM